MPSWTIPRKKSFCPKLREQAPHKTRRTSILRRKNFLPDAALTALVGMSAEKQHEYFFCIADFCVQDKRCGKINTCWWQNIVRHFLWENLRHEVARHKSRLCNWERCSEKRAGKNITTRTTTTHSNLMVNSWKFMARYITRTLLLLNNVSTLAQFSVIFPPRCDTKRHYPQQMSTASDIKRHECQRSDFFQRNCCQLMVLEGYFYWRGGNFLSMMEQQQAQHLSTTRNYCQQCATKVLFYLHSQEKSSPVQEKSQKVTLSPMQCKKSQEKSSVVIASTRKVIISHG